MAMSFDYAASGNSTLIDGTTNSITWSHTAAGGADCVVFGAIFSADRSGVSWAMYYAGTPMTQVGNAIPNGANNFRVYIFSLVNPPSGAQTVTATGTAGGTATLACNATTVSYKNVISVGNTMLSSGGSAASATLSVTSGKEYFCWIGADADTVSGLNATQRVLTPAGPYNWKLAAGDISNSPSAISATVTAGTWDVVAIDVTSASSASPSRFFAMF